MVEEEQERQSRPPVIKAVGKDIKRRNWALIGVMILVVGTLASFGLDYLLGLSGGGSILNVVGSKPTAIMAKAILTGAVSATDAYAATHDGTYSGMDGTTMAEIDAATQWAIGGPEKGKVAVTAVTNDSFTLIYTDQAGAEYTAVKTPQKLVMKDGSGNPI